MALGKPPVSGVRATDPRSVNGAIDNIRRRLEAIEAAFGQTELVAQVASNQSTLQVSNLAAQISSLDQRVTALENVIDLDIGRYTAGETIIAGQGVVGISGNTVGVADPSDPTRMFGLLGVALDNGSTGSAVRVQRRGVYSVPGSPAFITGRAVYLGDTGLTQTPDYEATALPIGVAVSASQVFVLPDWPAILYPAFSSGFADEYQRYLPVTLLAMTQAIEAGEYTIVAGSGIYVTYNYIAKTITISTSPPVSSASLDFSVAANSQYLALVSVGGM